MPKSLWIWSMLARMRSRQQNPSCRSQFGQYHRMRQVANNVKVPCSDDDYGCQCKQRESSV
ncbi:hypothetical protein JHK87_027050 [Glycine soja]|nr:hypothetical protein JHK87_027050 [Glycine soja]